MSSPRRRDPKLRIYVSPAASPAARSPQKKSGNPYLKTPRGYDIPQDAPAEETLLQKSPKKKKKFFADAKEVAVLSAPFLSLDSGQAISSTVVIPSAPTEVKLPAMKGGRTAKLMQKLGIDAKSIERTNFVEPEIYYYPKRPGHIAIKLNYQINGKPWSKYLSYGNKGASSESSVENEGHIYGKYHVLVLQKLPGDEKVRDARIASAFTGFENRERGKEYSLIKNNCMQVVLKFLQAAGYPITNDDISSTVRPAAGTQFLAKLNFKMLDENHARLLGTYSPADDKATIQLIKDLIKNEKEYLNTQWIHSQAEFVATYDIKKVESELRLLNAVLEKLNQAPMDIQAAFEGLCNTTNNPRLKKCLEIFPTQLLPDLENKRKFLQDFVKEIRAESKAEGQPPVLIKNWADELAKIDLQKVHPLNIHYFAYRTKSLLSEQLMNKKESPAWLHRAGFLLGMLEQKNIAAMQTPRRMR